MNSPAAVSNASPLIALEQVGRLELLERIFGTVLVPPAVVREVSPPLILPQWISERQLAQQLASNILSASLGPGESETIGLALEMNADWVILDDPQPNGRVEALTVAWAGTSSAVLLLR